LAAAGAEAERVQLDRRRAELQREEERWSKQLARDQEASAIVAHDISRYEARAVALQEAERLSALSEGPTVNDATLDAILTRVRLNLALAEALGATDEQLSPLRERADVIARKRPRSAKAAEALLLNTDGLIGQMRAQWPEPRPGASTELVETALVTGFAADRVGDGVLIRSERFFASNGDVSTATVKRFHGLLAAFPHGPVACQVAVPELRSPVWVRRVAALVARLRRMDDPGRVSTGMVVTQSLSAGAVQCTFAAYRGL
jgi:PAS domain-containing protein